MAALSFGSHSVVTGGSFTQVTNNNSNHKQPQTPWERLQSEVVPAAFHNSAERFDSPRCHPNTRVAVMNELRDLALRWGEAGNARILWLNGPAGAGKSAIAQTFCEECFATNFLLASFFFNRSDATRDNAHLFVATLTYQIYGKIPEYYQSLILGVIKDDPHVFGLSIDAQFKTLIMDPLQDLFRAGYFGKDAPALIVIDGLDECSGLPIQVSILRALESISAQLNSPFIFLITSRPEHDIQMFFTSSKLGHLLHRLNLDDSYLPGLDIELFLKERIQETCAVHPLKDSITQGWPSREAIQAIVQKSSGQFIYASVVVKYVTSSRHYPPTRLDDVLQLRPPKRDLPFAELDAIYTYIFSYVDDITLVLRILQTVILFQFEGIDIFIQDLDYICEVDQGDCLSVLCDLQSILRLEPTAENPVCLLHKSLPDYLQDPARSHDYYIDMSPTGLIPVVTQCLRYITDPTLDRNFQYLAFIVDHFTLLVNNIQLCHKDLMAFSPIDCWNTCHEIESEKDESWSNGLLWVAFEFLDKLCTLEGTDYNYIYYYHLDQFPKLVNQYCKVYWSSFPFQDQEDILSITIILTLLGDVDTHISPKVSEFLQHLPFHKLSYFPLDYSPILGLPNLSCAVALRCINSLKHGSSHRTVAFALECLALILPDARLSLDLNAACLSGLLSATMGDCGEFVLVHMASLAMQEYRERYTKGQYPEWE